MKKNGWFTMHLSLLNVTKQMTAIPVSTEARIREFVFECHREGAICNAKHIAALLKDEFKLDIQDRTMRRHLARMGFVWSQTKKQTRSLRESSRVRQQRHDYLYEIRKTKRPPAKSWWVQKLSADLTAD